MYVYIYIYIYTYVCMYVRQKDRTLHQTNWWGSDAHNLTDCMLKHRPCGSNPRQPCPLLLLIAINSNSYS